MLRACGERQLSVSVTHTTTVLYSTVLHFAGQCRYNDSTVAVLTSQVTGRQTAPSLLLLFYVRLPVLSSCSYLELESLRRRRESGTTLVGKIRLHAFRQAGRQTARAQSERKDRRAFGGRNRLIAGLAGLPAEKQLRVSH